MAQILSKEDEKKILSKIVKMVEGISENKDDSYIRIAFEGFEAMALNNIEYDTGNSVAQYRKCWEQTSSENRELEKKAKAFQDKHEESLRIIEMNKKAEAEMCKFLNDKVNSLETQLLEAHALKEKTMDNLQGIIDTLNTKTGNMAKALEEVTASKDLEIMKLKAELYDLKK